MCVHGASLILNSNTPLSICRKTFGVLVEKRHCSGVQQDIKHSRRVRGFSDPELLLLHTGVPKSQVTSDQKQLQVNRKSRESTSSKHPDSSKEKVVQYIQSQRQNYLQSSEKAKMSTTKLDQQQISGTINSLSDFALWLVRQNIEEGSCGNSLLRKPTEGFMVHCSAEDEGWKLLERYHAVLHTRIPQSNYNNNCL